MSISRKWLEGMGLSAEAVEAIVEANSQSVSGIKAERDSLKLELDRVKGEIDSKAADYEKKLSELQKSYDDFKAETAAKAVRAEKEKMYADLLVESNIPQARVAAILRLTDFDKVEIEDGKLKDVKALKENISKEWADYILEVTTTDDTPPHPPVKNEPAKMKREDIFKITDPVERQKAIKENIELFQKA